jgi:flagellar M-ring protein FliF
LKQIQDLASAVLGLDASRGDVVTVENIPFTVTPLQPAPALRGFQRVGPILNQYGVIVRYFFLGLLALLIFMFVLRPLMKQLGSVPRALPPATAAALGSDEAPAATAVAMPALAAAPARPAELPALSAQKDQLALLRDTLASKVSRTPAVAGRLVEGWIREDGE